jgi:acetolactate synthase-1/2/3 large subunit
VKFHEAMAHALLDQGMGTVFGLMGDGNLFMVDSFQRIGGRYIAMTNEAAAIEAAVGYAHTSDQLGVATVTHGPALTNTVTALVEAVKGATPLVVLVGDTAVADRENLQNIDQRAIVSASGAGFEQIRAPDTLALDLATAVRRAQIERRPVVLNMPVEFQWVDVDVPRSVARAAVVPNGRAASQSLDDAVGLIASARRPIVLAGWGAIGASARSALIHLAERIGAPLATTLNAKDLFRGEAHDLGVIGTVADQLAVTTVGQSDLVIAFGASLNRRTTAENWLLSGRRLIQVDIDRAGVGRYVEPDIAVIGDAAAVADELVEWLDAADVPATTFASAELGAQIAALREVGVAPAGLDNAIDIRTALLQIEAAFPRERTVVLDGGRFMASGFELLHSPDPRGFLHTVNFGAIGLGTGTAIGASAGAPDRPVLLVAGDGGFMLGGLGEFNTAVRYGLEVVVVVLNDGAYGAEHIQFVQRGLDPAGATFDWPDLGPVADALGGIGFTVRTSAELDAALAATVAAPRPWPPVLIDVKLDPFAVPSFSH